MPIFLLQCQCQILQRHTGGMWYRRSMNEIQKLDNVTWYGHCVMHIMAALNDLPDEAKLGFCQELSKFIRRQERALREADA